MAVTDTKIHPNAKVGLKCLRYAGSPAISQTNVAFARYKPGFKFEIVAVRANARTVNGYSVPEVRIVDAAANTGQNVLTGALTPAAVASASPAEGALQSSRVLRRGSATSEIVLHLTTGGTAPVDPNVEIWIRPYPLNGEV